MKYIMFHTILLYMLSMQIKYIMFHTILLYMLSMQIKFYLPKYTLCSLASVATILNTINIIY